MPAIRKLSTEEVEVVQRGGKGPSQRQVVANEYDGYLADLSVGDYAEVELGEDESRLTVGNRFRSAAERKGVALQFKRSQGSIMRFQLVALEDASEENGHSSEEVPDAPIGSDAPPKRGRPRKKTA